MDHTQESEHSRMHGSSRHFHLRVDDSGRVVIPAEAMKQLGLEGDDRVVLRLEEDRTATLFCLLEQVRELQGIFADLEPGESWSKELIQERREEARRELEEQA